MQAIVQESYGSPDLLRLTELPTPTPTADQILIKIHACSINGSDRENLIGKPLYARIGGLRKPGNRILGSDIAGTVAAVGKNHTEFKVGDELFGELPGYHGGFAEYVCTSGETLAIKPANLTFAQAAAIPQAGVIAWRGIREKGQVQAGQTVLINGAGGSAGSFAIQLAKLAGAEVTGVDGPNQLEFMRSLGADYVIDYTKQEFTTSGKAYDLILDMVAHRSVFALPQALRPNGTYYVTGGAVSVLVQTLLLGGMIKRTRGKNIRMLVVPQNRADVVTMAELCAAGEITPMIDREFPLHAVPDAMRYVADGQAKGKVVIKIT